jgi:hypothetical protein
MTQQRAAARMHGFIRAVADQSHPLQTRLSLILTDFEPNRNKQAVPRAEAENILRTAVNSPLKINFDGTEFYGHKGAKPIGTIVQPTMGDDNGREVIFAEAIVWNDINPDVDEHIRMAFAEGVGTSWEIYFDPDKSVQDDNGVEWLGGCVFAGTCIVDTPAYGPNRTRLLAIAEELHKRDETMENEIMAQANDTVVNDKETTDTPAEAAESVTNEISGAMDLLSKLYEGLWTMIDEAADLERELAATDITAVAEQFTKAISGIQKQFDALKSKAAKAELVEAELNTLKEGIANAEAEKAEAEKLDTRKASLAELGVDIEAKKDFYLGMAEEMFTQYVEDLRAVKGTSAKAEVKKPIIPDATVSNGSVTLTTSSLSELAAVLRGDK